MILAEGQRWRKMTRLEVGRQACRLAGWVLHKARKDSILACTYEFFKVYFQS